MVQIRQAQTQPDIAACMALRWEVFVEEQGVPEADELDGTDEGATHVMALRADRMIGAARYHLVDGIAKIGRVCVVRTARGSGIGAALIRYIESEVRHTAKHARLGAQVSAQSFYAGLGYLPVGDVYQDAGIPHQDMEKDLK